MSVSASIDVHLAKCNSKHPLTIEIIQLLTQEGWTLIRNNYISYLPVGDKDDFNWQDKEDMTFTEFAHLVQAKEKASEIIGMILTWRDTDIGGSFLFWPKYTYETFSINLNSNRQKIILDNDYSITNFQWYLEKLLPPLNNAFGVEYFACEEHR